ncbi:hypothetical protein Hypma_003778 [Hypsizygus marmoreus]|uniref:Uncharacterized protein n=1 Tax=Hypsizygus marmoreus TaxID=39966 RepID=A0A369K4B7_HYPMA|nr:hypothetical protein Hypma_003778 [Hypsizygus marmoreus]
MNKKLLLQDIITSVAQKLANAFSGGTDYICHEFTNSSKQAFARSGLPESQTCDQRNLEYGYYALGMPRFLSRW